MIHPYWNAHRFGKRGARTLDVSPMNKADSERVVLAFQKALKKHYCSKDKIFCQRRGGINEGL